MKFNSAIILLATMMFIFTGCSEDVDTPADKRRSSYLAQPLKAAKVEVVNCKGKSVTLPQSRHNQSLESYLLEVHMANKQQDLSKVGIAQLQLMYRDCLRPKIIERL